MASRAVLIADRQLNMIDSTSTWLRGTAEVGWWLHTRRGTMKSRYVLGYCVCLLIISVCTAGVGHAASIPAWLDDAITEFNKNNPAMQRTDPVLALHTRSSLRPSFCTAPIKR